MATETDIVQLQFRQGLKADLVAGDLIPGEPVYATDTAEIGVALKDGTILWVATAGAGANKAVLASEKGSASGVMPLPATLPATETILKMAAGGMPASAKFGDFATGIQSAWNTTDYWIKYPDGTMEVSAVLTFTTGATYGDFAWPFATAFATTQNLIVTPPMVSVGPGAVVSMLNDLQPYRAQFIFVKIDGTVLKNVTMTARFSAKGRWK